VDLNFTHATAVDFGSVGASFTVSADTQINATVPNSATTGAITVVSNSTSYKTGSNFVVVPSGAPLITSFTPANGGGAAPSSRSTAAIFPAARRSILTAWPPHISN